MKGVLCKATPPGGSPNWSGSHHHDYHHHHQKDKGALKGETKIQTETAQKEERLLKREKHLATETSQRRSGS
jgi:hypothetical protein